MTGVRRDIISELHKSSRKNFPRRQVRQRGINGTWQGDLVEMIPYAKENKNFKYLLTVIDIFSKKAYVRAVKNKTGELVSKAMNDIFLESGTVPLNLHTDLGKEFYNHHFVNLMKKNKINHYSTFSHLKASIVERFNKTLKNLMWKTFSLQGSYKWLDIVLKLVNKYNSTRHSTIKMAPNAVNKQNEKILLETVYKVNDKLMRAKFHVGDYVRISKYKKIFEKGYTPNFTTEIFKVTHVNRKFPVTYLLEDYKKNAIAGRFYEHELLKTKFPDTYLVEKVLKKNNDKIFVKWLRFDKSHNSWINKSDLN